MNVAVIGLGYVGAVTAGCMARLGRTVIGVDTDPHKADAIAAGRSPISEPGLDDLIAEGVASGRLRSAIAEAVARLGRDHGGRWYAERAVRGARPAAVLRVTRRSDMRCRTTDASGRWWCAAPYCRAARTSRSARGWSRFRLRAGWIRSGHEPGIPARVGSSIRDFFEATRTIIGADDERPPSGERRYEGVAAPVFVVPIRTSELVKYTDNAFHALKIAFANEISPASRAPLGVDGREVMGLMTADDRLNICPPTCAPATPSAARACPRTFVP